MALKSHTNWLTPVLVLAFLSAGAFADNQPSNVTPNSKNITIIEKNNTWPLPSELVSAACKVDRCIDV